MKVHVSNKTMVLLTPKHVFFCTKHVFAIRSVQYEIIAHILCANSLKSVHNEIDLRAVFRSIFTGYSIAKIDKFDLFDDNP